VIAVGFKLCVSLEQSRVKLVGALDSRAQNRRAQAVKLPPARIHNQQPLGGKNFRVEIGEGLREGAAGLVGSDQGIGSVGRPSSSAARSIAA